MEQDYESQFNNNNNNSNSDSSNRRNVNRIPQEEVINITQSLPIPEYKMGWIIGKRGTYINQLAKKSGASITISDSKSKEYGTVWKYIQISGSGRAVDRAKKLLHIRLERLEPRNMSQEEGGVNDAVAGDNDVETDDIINDNESSEKDNNQKLNRYTQGSVGGNQEELTKSIP